MKPYNPRLSASRVPALFDEHRYMTRFMAWQMCANGKSPDGGDNKRARSGRFLEGAILQMAAEDLGCEVVHLPQNHREDSIKHATLPTSAMGDGLALHPEKGVGYLEVKNVGEEAWYRRWKSQEHRVPVDVEMQLQTTMQVLRNPLGDTLGVPKPEWGAVVALEGGSDLHIFEREIEERWVPVLEDGLTKFFDSIHKDQPPPLSYVPEELPLAKELWPVKEPERIESFNGDEEAQVAAATIIDQFIKAQKQRKDVGAEFDSLKIELLEMAQGAGVILVPGYRCRIAQIDVKPSHIDCPHCSTSIETRRGNTQVRFYPKQL